VALQWLAFLPMAASKCSNRERNLPRAIVGGTLLVLAIYLLVNVAYLYALPVPGGRELQLHGVPGCAVGCRQDGSNISRCESGAHCSPDFFSSRSVGALNGTILARARVPYAAARDGLSSRALVT